MPASLAGDVISGASISSPGSSDDLFCLRAQTRDNTPLTNPGRIYFS